MTPRESNLYIWLGRIRARLSSCYPRLTIPSAVIYKRSSNPLSAIKSVKGGPMKRTLGAVLLMCVLILWPAHAKQDASPMRKADTTTAKSSIQWETVDGSQVLRLWQLEGPKLWPQTTIMRVSHPTYQKYFQDPKKFVQFVNAHKFFSKDVITAGPWVTLSSVQQDVDSPNWVLTLMHGKSSTLIVSALPQLTTEETQ
jgi:hypothetical protein